MSDADSCRICLGDNTDGRFISPCKCKGSMGKVHAHCLEQWRTTSDNPHSYYRCEQCLYYYSYTRTPISKVLHNKAFIWIASIIYFTTISFIFGYLLCNRAMTRVPPMAFYDYAARYIVAGIVLMGFIGIITLIIGPFGVILFHMNMGTVYLYSYDYSSTIISILLFIGALNAFREVYLVVNMVIDKCISKTEHLIENVE